LFAACFIAIGKCPNQPWIVVQKYKSISG